MEDTIYKGDVLLVNKVCYGPSLPKSAFEIAWIGLLVRKISAKNQHSMELWPYRRLKGLEILENDDVVVYQNKIGDYMVKRCAGVHGNKLQIIEGIIYLDGKKCIPQNTIKDRYQISLVNKKSFFEEIDSLGIKALFSKSTGQRNLYDCNLSKREAEIIHKLTSVKRISKIFHSYSKETGLFASSTERKWTLDNMGPFKIPQRGMKIQLNNYTYEIYSNTIKEHEGKFLYKEQNEFFNGNGEKITSYIFTQDYCFLLGDNRKNSADSRFYGFYPERNIIGKVTRVLYSETDGNFRWKRLLKSVHAKQVKL